MGNSLSGTPINKYRVFDFSGGLNTTDYPQALQEKESSDVLNMTFFERGAAKKREGLQKMPYLLPNDKINGLIIGVIHTFEEKQIPTNSTGTDVAHALSTSVQKVKGSHYLYGVFHQLDSNNEPTNTLFFRYVQNSDGTTSYKEYSFNGGSTYIVYGKPSMFIYNQVVYVLANNYLFSYNNADDTFYPTTNHIDMKEGILFHNRMFYIGKTDNPELVYFSELGDPASISMTVSNDSGANSTSTAGGVIAARSDRGDTPTTGLAVFLNSLIIFKEDGVFALTGYNPDTDFALAPLNVSTGALNQRLIAMANNGVYYLGKDGNVYMLTTPYQGYIATKPISTQITKDLWKLLNDDNYPIDTFHMQYYRNKLYLFARNLCFMYDERLQIWTKFSFPMEITFTYVDPMFQELVLFTNVLYNGANYSYYFKTDQLYDEIDPTTNEKLGISAHFQTAYYYFKEPEVTKRYRYCKIFYKPHVQNFDENEPDHRTSSFDVKLEINYNGQTKVVQSDHTNFIWGESNWGDYWGDPMDSKSVMIRFGGSGEMLRLTFSNDKPYQPLEIHGFVIGYKPQKRVR